MAVPANRLQILKQMGTSVRAELPMMDLQTMRATAMNAFPSLFVEHAAAVDLVHPTDEQCQCKTLFAMTGFGDQLFSCECSVADGSMAVFQPAHLVAGQHF